MQRLLRNICWLGLAIGSGSLFAEVEEVVQELADPWQALAKGGLEAFLGMDHLVFALLIGFALFAQWKRPRLLLITVLTWLLGYLLSKNIESLAFEAEVLGALTLALFVLVMWLQDRLLPLVAPLLALGGLAHGLSLGLSFKFETAAAYVSYGVGAGIVQIATALGIGIYARGVARLDPDKLEGLENILSATAVGVAMTYFVRAF